MPYPRLNERKSRFLLVLSPYLQVSLPICEGYLLELLVHADKGGEVAGATSIAKGDGVLDAIVRVQEHREVSPAGFVSR